VPGGDDAAARCAARAEMAADGVSTRSIARTVGVEEAVEAPDGCARWTAPLLSQRLGDVHEQHIWRVLRKNKIDLAGRKSWCESQLEIALCPFQRRRETLDPGAM
jgi:hypothetical protein